MKLVLILSAALGFLQLPTLALAGDSCGGGSQVQALFDAADADGDGVLSAAEYGDSELARFGASFDEIDADGNGESSLVEYLELYQRHHAVDVRLSL